MNERLDSLVQRRHALLNLVHTWLLVGGSIGLLAVCAWAFSGPQGIWYAAIFGGVSLFMASRVSPAMVLRMYRAVPVGPDRFPAGHAILDELARRAGLPSRPQLYILPSNMMNAFAVGRLHDSAICFTDKLVRSLTRRELAGVMAHEVSHIRNQDIRVMAIADMVSRFTSAMSTFGMISVFLNLPAILYGGAPGVPWIAVALLVGAPSIGGLLQMALSRTREYDADLNAVMLTGDPVGLASALMKLERAQGRLWEGMVLPGGRIPEPSILRTHPPTAERVARIMALKPTAQGEAEIAAPRNEEAPRRSAPSPVPRIQPKWGRGEESRYSDYASLITSAPAEPVVPGEEAERPCCEESINPPRGKPRIRMGGGVYW